MIDGSEKRNRQLAFELQNSHVCEKSGNISPLVHFVLLLWIILDFQAEAREWISDPLSLRDTVKGWLVKWFWEIIASF